MLSLVALFGVLIILTCVVGSVNPPALLALVDRFSSKSGFVLAILVRVVLGVAALLATPDSLSPLFLTIIGVISLAAAVALPLMGIGRYKGLLDWVGGLGPAIQRLWLTFGLFFGAALVWVSGIA
jgi:hypothetical protein